MARMLGYRSRGSVRSNYSYSRSDYYDDGISRQEEREYQARRRAPEIVKSAVVITDSFGREFGHSIGLGNQEEPFIRQLLLNFQIMLLLVVFKKIVFLSQ